MSDKSNILSGVVFADSSHTDVLCTSCWGNDTEMIAEVIPGLYLIYPPTDQYILLDEGGHSTSVVATMESKPTIDPMPLELARKFDKDIDGFGEEYEQYLMALQAQTIWMDAAKSMFHDLIKGKEEDSPLSMTETWELVNRFIEAGYDPYAEFYAEVWMFNRMAHIIAAWENRKEE